MGDAVGIKWLATACLDHCEDCLSGNEGLCAEQKASGYDLDGTFQQYVVSDARYVTPIPDGLALDIAAPRELDLRNQDLASYNADLLSPSVLCAGVTSWRAIKEVREHCLR